jgi:hypothetical protein
MKKITISILPFLQSSSIINLEQKHLAFQETLVPHTRLKADLAKQFVTILYAEHRHIRIFTAIGAKGRYFAFLSSFKKGKN